MEFKHYSVLLNETIEQLHIRPDGIYVDGTLGGGGHSLQICRHLTTGRLIGIDQDADAIAAATERLKDYADRVTIVRSNYAQMADVLKNLGIEKVDGIILDLGVSSFQLDTPERGFSYMNDGPLDMRMDKDAPLTTGELNAIIRGAIPMKVQVTGGHPSKRTYQAIRIELNHELDVLRDTLDTMIDLLNDGGRICIITFHSLEDRIVKSNFKKNENPCTCPSNFPVCVCGKKSKGRVVTRKPVLPSEKELEENSRSKSAKLRVFERVEDGMESREAL